jgi:UDP-N-acetylglucosamine transferase subunit ALG13
VAGIAEVLPKGSICRKAILIFLTVGTWYKGFDRLVQAADELVGSGVVAEEVIAQIGYSSYKPKNLKTVDFCSPDQFIEHISRSDMVISHAGLGTIAQAVGQGKPIIVVPRRCALGEVTNDHQFTTARQFEAEGRILAAYDVADLPAKIRQAKTFVPVRKCAGPGKILEAVEEFIQGVAAGKRK